MKAYLYAMLIFGLTVPMFFVSARSSGGGSAGNPGGASAGNPGGTSAGNPGDAPSFGAGTVRLQDPLDGTISSIPDFLRAVIEVLLVFAIPFVVFFIILAGFKYVTARGNPNTIQEAHKALLYAIIGGLLILGANLILDIITNTVAEVTN